MFFAEKKKDSLKKTQGSVVLQSIKFLKNYMVPHSLL